MKNNTAILLIIILILSFILGCEKDPAKFETITISQPGFFELEVCEERGLNDKVIMIGSKYCGHCVETKPIFIEASEEKGIESIILDLAEEEHRNQLKTYGIEVQFTPTFIYGCEYYVGAYTKEQYLNFSEIFSEQ